MADEQNDKGPEFEIGRRCLRARGPLAINKATLVLIVALLVFDDVDVVEAAASLLSAILDLWDWMWPGIEDRPGAALHFVEMDE